VWRMESAADIGEEGTIRYLNLDNEPQLDGTEQKAILLHFA